ncbi:helix-turn-helix transcriptional regulator [Erwinia sp. V71]|uniref:helix-turn-helix transcriptional regulator n=1 Tax=Erwinia sp. V71 TaxID=3369424 RepID=UPI003F648156
MAGTTGNPHHEARHDPANITENAMQGVPESWARIMRFDQPLEGVNICCMSGQPDTSWSFQAEGGPSLSMSILLEGCIESAIDHGDVFMLNAGSVILSATAQHLSGSNILSPAPDFRMVNINLTPAALGRMTGLSMDDVLKYMRSTTGGMPHVDACVAHLPLFSALQRLAAEMSQCHYLDSKARNVFLCAKVSEALAAVLDQCSRERGNASTLRAVPSDRLRLLQARAMLEDRHQEPWSVQSLAQAVGLNEKRLQAGFNALYGSTVHESLTRIRLDVALAMLSSGASVTDTAQAVGFANVSHFSKVFRNTIGVSPRRWVHGHPPAK